jgi:homogentisate 1,2-dioxygenase
MGTLDIQTEMGTMRVRPREICVVPRGIRFRVSLPQGPARGHVIEAFSGHFDVPELGPIGSLGLANVRDFEIPSARYHDTKEVTEVWAKFAGRIHKANMNGSAFNAVSWHGTYYPFKYDLGTHTLQLFFISQMEVESKEKDNSKKRVTGKFMPMGSTLYDHQVCCCLLTRPKSMVQRTCP